MTIESGSWAVPESILIERLAEGVYAAIAVPGQGSLGNAGIVDLGDQTLVFDTLRTPRAAMELSAAAERLTGRRATWVVNSHWHDDHVAGNQVFVPGASIIATEMTRDLMTSRLVAEYAQDAAELPAILQTLEKRLAVEGDERAREELGLRIAENRRYAEAIPSIRVTPPDLTFGREMRLHGKTRTVELWSYGGGHTTSDAFLYLADERIMFAGDLAFLDYHPWLPDGDPGEWVRIIGEIERLSLNTVVPGHGPVTDRRCLTLTREYIETLERLADEMARSGITPETVTDVPVPTPFDTWSVAQFAQANMRFVLERRRNRAG